MSGPFAGCNDYEVVPSMSIVGLTSTGDPTAKPQTPMRSRMWERM